MGKKDCMINAFFFFLVFLFLMAFLPKHQLDSYGKKNEGYAYFEKFIMPKLEKLTYSDFKMDGFEKFTYKHGEENSEKEFQDYVNVLIAKKSNTFNVIRNQRVEIWFINETFAIREYFNCYNNFVNCKIESFSDVIHHPPSYLKLRYLTPFSDWFSWINKINQIETFTDKINGHDVECYMLSENVNLILGYSYKKVMICLEKNTNVPIKSELILNSKFKEGIFDFTPYVLVGNATFVTTNFTIGSVSEDDILKPILIDRYEYSYCLRTNATINLKTGEIIK